MATYENILGTIGRTPTVRIGKLAPAHVRLYAKVEAFNPMGSVKDRLALGVIEDAERSGQLKPGQTVIEATSGNTGIGLAMVCASKGYPLVLVMAENFSVERRKLMRFFGAKVVLTPAAAKGSGMLAKAEELAERHGWFLCRQFENEANARMHARTTAREIVADFDGQRLDYFVTGYGTGGTLKGVASVLRQERPHTRIIVCEPDNSPVLASGLPQPRTDQGGHVSHPSFRPHLMQGWSPDFIPKLTADAVANRWLDGVLPINGERALHMAHELARQEGILAGITGGATLAGALDICAQAEPGATVLCMLPDTGERYLSTPLFADVPEQMTDEELEIARSTPSCRFDRPPPSPAPTPEPAEEPAVSAASAEAEAFVAHVIADPAHPVVMFALQWCEFCWAVRRMFAAYGIPFQSIDLDSVEYQRDDRGGHIRAALNRRTRMTTIPQIFVAGELIGGCTEVFDAWRQGRLQQLLSRNGIAHDPGSQQDPGAFLPGWLHPR